MHGFVIVYKGFFWIEFSFCSSTASVQSWPNGVLMLQDDKEVRSSNFVLFVSLMAGRAPVFVEKEIDFDFFLSLVVSL